MQLSKTSDLVLEQCPPMSTHHTLTRVLRVLDYIHENANTELSLDALAEGAALSRFHWHRVFSAMMGASPADVIRMVRLH